MGNDMTTSISQRLEAAQNRRYSAIAKMEAAISKMERSERTGQGVDPLDAASFEENRQAVGAIDVELRELQAQARSSLGTDGNVDVMAGSGMGGIPEALGSGTPYSRAFVQTGRVDSAALWRALQSSPNSTTGKVICRALLQGVAAGTMGRTTADGSVVPVGTYGANPLVLSVQTIPTMAGLYHFNRVEAVTPPALGAKQTAEGAAKQNVALDSTPVSLTLETWAAYEKVSLQALQDQAGLAMAVESLLIGAVLRAADAAAWTAFLAGSTAVTALADGVSTIVTTAAAIASAGGQGIRALLSPADYAAMMLTKASTSGNWLGLPQGIDVPTIVQSSGVPSGKVLVTASSDGAFVALRQQVEAMIGLDADDFTKNLRTVLVEGRFAFGVRNAGLSYAGDLTT